MAKTRRIQDGVPGMDLLVCRNPKAAARFEIEETIEVGLILQGSEVKSLRQRRADLEGAYGAVHGGELWLHKAHIAPYEQGGPHFNHEPKRSRKCLAHKQEIERLHGKLATRGYSLIPLQLYFKNGHAKVQLGLGKGKKAHDDRETIKRKVDLREARDAMKDR